MMKWFDGLPAIQLLTTSHLGGEYVPCGFAEVREGGGTTSFPGPTASVDGLVWVCGCVDVFSV